MNIPPRKWSGAVCGMEYAHVVALLFLWLPRSLTKEPGFTPVRVAW